MPCAAQASHETVARALTLLRLTRWLSLVRRRRDPKTGRILGNLYVLHDEPLTPFEAMQLDPDYLGLVSQALTHAAKAVQIVGMNTLRRSPKTRCSAAARCRRAAGAGAAHGAHGWTTPGYPQEGADHESEEAGSPSSECAPVFGIEAGPKPAPDGSLRIPKEDRTVRNDRINEVRTVPRARALQNLRLPERFLRLKDEQQAGALVALQQVDEAQRQAVLDEWAARCHNSAVRNPAGYLFGIIQKAIRGEFKAWAGESASAPPAPPSPALVTAGIPCG
jgi:hypothetical protein